MADEIIIIKESDQVVNVVEAESDEEKAIVVTSESEVKRFESSLSAINSRLTAQEAFNKDVTYTETIDSDIAYEKSIPTSARLGFINKIGGMSQRIGNELITAKVESVSISSKTIPMPSALKRIGMYGINESVYDYIDIENKQLVKRCGTFVIDDTSTIYSIEARTNAIRIQYRIVDSASGYCECVFSNLDYLKSWDSEVTHGYMYNNTARVILNGITTQADALTWLRSNPVTVVYELAEPITEDLTYVLDSEDIANPFNCNGGTITFNQAQPQKIDIPNEVEYVAKVEQFGYKLIADTTLTESTTLVTIPNVNCKNVQIMVVRNGQKTTSTADEVRVNSNSTGRVAARFARTSGATAKIMAKSFIDFEAPIRKMEYMTTYTSGGSVNYSMYYFTGLESEERVNTLYFVATAETFNVGDEFIVYGR